MINNLFDIILIVWLILMFFYVRIANSKKLSEYYETVLTSIDDISYIFPFIFFIISLIVVAALVLFNGSIGRIGESILSGLIVGLLTLIISIIINYSQLKAIDLFKRLKIKNILRSRSDPIYYSKVIKNAKSKLWVMGVTASRLTADFIDDQSPEESKKILLKKIENGLKLRLLLPDFRDGLPDNVLKPLHESTLLKLSKLPVNTRKNIEIKFYDSKPAHSIFSTENECIVGPIFPGVESKHTPGIHLESNGDFVNQYLKYFEDEWKKAKIHNWSS